MALGDDYGALTTLKSRLGIGDSVDNTELQNALTAASRGVETFCRRQFQRDTATARTFRARHWWLAHVDDFHTTAGLVVATDNGDDGTFGTTWSASDYQLEPLDGVVAGQQGWPFYKLRAVETKWFPQGRRAGLQVTAQWGWAEVPEPVTEAALILAEEIFKLKDAPFGVAGYGEFGAVRVRDNPKVARMLTPYRRDAVLVG